MGSILYAGLTFSRQNYFPPFREKKLVNSTSGVFFERCVQVLSGSSMAKTSSEDYIKKENFQAKNLAQSIFTQPLHSGRIWHKVNF